MKRQHTEWEKIFANDLQCAYSLIKKKETQSKTLAYSEWCQIRGL